MSEPLASDEWLTSAEAALLLGVGVSTLKRWVDGGELASERTAGGHRRLRRVDVERFRVRLTGLDPVAEGPSARLVELLLSDAPSQEVEARLLKLRGRAGSAAALGDFVAPALDTLGRQWAEGRISIVDEHLASERLARALSRLVEWTPLAAGAPRALLATAEGDDHTLGLSMCELVLREAGWATAWAGRRTPADELAASVRDGARRFDLVVLSASVASSDRRALERQERAVGAACAAAEVPLLVGGGGPWPARPRWAEHVRTLRELDALARTLRAGPRATRPPG